MEQRMNDPTGWIWFGFTCLLAVTLAVNGMQALFGTAKFAYWHIGTLVAGYMMTRATLTDVQLASVQRLWEAVHRLVDGIPDDSNRGTITAPAPAGRA